MKVNNRDALVLLLAIVALIAAFFPYANKGPYGVGLFVLLDYLWLSPFGGVSIVLLVTAPLLALVSLKAIYSKTKNVSLWYLILGGMGVAATLLSIMEGHSHIKVFSSFCASLPGLKTSTEPASNALGGYLLIVVYSLIIVTGVSDSKKS